MVANKKIISIFAVLLISLSAVFSQAAVNRASELIEKNLVIADYDKAYYYSLFILRFYGSDEIPFEHLSSIKKAVKAQADNLANQKNWTGLEQMKTDLESAPEAVLNELSAAFSKYDSYKKIQEEERIKKLAEEQALIQKIKDEEAALAQKETFQASETSSPEPAVEKPAKHNQAAPQYQPVPQQIIVQNKTDNSQVEKLLKQFEESRKQDQEKLREQEEARIAQEKHNQEMTQLMMEEFSKTISSNSRSNTMVIIVLIIVFMIIMFVIFIVIYLVIRSQKIQTEQLHATMETMHAMRTISATTQNLQIGLENAASNKLLLGSSDMPNLEGNPEAKELQDLINKCKEYGAQIDNATNRKNVSARVAELVFKISCEMGNSQVDSMLHYAAAFVYDIGFLSIDTSILRSEILSKDQFETLKTHAQAGINMVFFVPEKYRQLFQDAVSKHHENLDGSGYPQNLSAKEIPYIARLLHVVESYIALISRRSYKKTIDTESAIHELKKEADHYDQEIVDALSAVI